MTPEDLRTENARLREGVEILKRINNALLLENGQLRADVAKTAAEIANTIAAIRRITL